MQLRHETPYAWLGKGAVQDVRRAAPAAAVQHTIPDLPPIDWEHIRKKQVERRRSRGGGRARRGRPPIFTAPAEQQEREP